MLHSPKSDSFVLILPDNFIYPSIIERYKPIFDAKNFMFSNIHDFLNATVTGVNFTGIKTKVQEQTLGKESRKQRYRSGINAKEQTNKELVVNFKMTTGFLNYFMMLDQLVQYNDSTNEGGNPSLVGNDTFLNSITLLILGNDGNIWFERIYDGIVINSIDDLNLSKEAVKYKSLDFTVRFAYNDYQIKNNISEKVNKIQKEYRY